MTHLPHIDPEEAAIAATPFDPMILPEMPDLKEWQEQQRNDYIIQRFGKMMLECSKPDLVALCANAPDAIYDFIASVEQTQHYYESGVKMMECLTARLIIAMTIVEQKRQ